MKNESILLLSLTACRVYRSLW